MALPILPAIIVSFIVLVGLYGTYYIYRVYRRVRFTVPDVERTPHFENVDQFRQQPTQLSDIEHPQRQYYSSQWYGSGGVVPAHIAPAAKALPQIPEIEYTGGEGLISPPDRVFRSSDDVERINKGRIRETDGSQEQELHAGRPWNFGTDGYGNSVAQPPELLSPKPMRTATRTPKAEPTNTAYDSKQTAAADIWEKITKGQLQPSRRKTQKKPPKPSDAPIPEVLRDPAEFENGVLQDVDLGSSTKEWAKPRISSAYVTKRPSKRGSFDNTITAVDDTHVNSERPSSNVKRKQSVDNGAPKPAQPLDRAAEARRKMLEAKTQMAERKKQEEEERQAEERRQAEEQKQREVEQQEKAERKERERDEEEARSLTQMGVASDENPFDTRDSEALVQSTRRRSSTSNASKRERKSRERLLTPKRANTFTNDATASADDIMTDKKRSGSGNGTFRSMSMNDQARPDFTATMPSIAEGGTRDADNTKSRGEEGPSSDNMGRRSDGSTRTSESSGYASRYNNGRPSSKDIPENPFASANDPETSFVSVPRSSGASSNESRSQAQRRSNASSNDSRISSDSPRSHNYPERNNSRTSAKSRDSAGSQNSAHSSSNREKPERKSSLATRALSKLGRKSSSSDKKDRDSASSTQSWERDGPGLRGGGKVYVEEPEEMSGSEDEDKHGHRDWGEQDEEVEHGVKMRGGAGEEVQESESKSGLGAENDDESDASDAKYSDNDLSDNEHSEDSQSESDEDTEEHDSCEDEVSDDDKSEDEHSESEGSIMEHSDAGSTNDEAGDEVLDDEREEVLQNSFETTFVKARER